MKYSIRIACENQARVINFTSELQMTVVSGLFRAVVKDNYSLHLSPFCKKHRGKALSFEEALHEAQGLRFFKTETASHEEITHSWEYVTSLRFPCEVFVNQFNSDWGGTFFEISFEDKNLVKPDFDAIKSHLEKYGIDLLKSKTEGLWYSHRFLELTNLRNDILIRRRHTVHEWVSKTEKIEL